MTFDEWWNEVGSGIFIFKDEEPSEHAKRVSLEAWCFATTKQAEPQRSEYDC